MVSTKAYAGLGRVPVGIGAVLRGWDLTEDEYRNPERLPILDFCAMTERCRHDCFNCFTDKIKKTITLSQIKEVIDQAAEMGCRGINYLGEGEPTLDEDFLEILVYTGGKGIVPVVFTDGATRMRDRGFVRAVKQTGASVCPKCDSLINADYQNWVVGKPENFFDERNEALELLIEEGFNEVADDGTTRLGFDMILTRQNIHEVPIILPTCREQNIWIVFSFYIPAGRCRGGRFDADLAPTEEQKQWMRTLVREIDRLFGFVHPIYSNFATIRCLERLFIRGNGDVQPCPGNEAVIGDIRTDSLTELNRRVIERFPCHDPCKFDGHCLYRP
jgi:MoaA/NifB/PqqE/SkfB family radical SAM enzyme